MPPLDVRKSNPGVTMMALLAYLLFAAVLATSLWTIYATVAPKLPLIVHLLRHGPIMTPALPAEPRGTVRGAAVRVRVVASATALRATA
jgi:hypothetical protein